MSILTQEYLKSILNYDHDTGVFKWKHRSDIPKEINARFSSMMTGEKLDHGYRRIVINSKKYYAHRLAWLYVNGYFPKITIDHIDGDKSNNKISNLREATYSQNQCNLGTAKNNRSGLKGVTYDKRQNNWFARIKINKKQIYLGSYGCPTAAHFAYCRAAKQYHGEYMRTE